MRVRSIKYLSLLLIVTTAATVGSCAESIGEGTELVPRNTPPAIYELKGASGVIIDDVYYPMCELIATDLNSRPNRPAAICERNLDVNLGFSEPPWDVIADEDIDWALVEKLFAYETRRSYGSEYQRFWPHEQERLKRMEQETGAILWSTLVDIDNDGEDELIYRLRRNTCDSSSLPSNRQVDGHIFSVKEGQVEDLGWYMGGKDIIRFQDHTFLSTWEGSPLSERPRLLIYDTTKILDQFVIEMSNGCEVEYRYSINNQRNE